MEFVHENVLAIPMVLINELVIVLIKKNKIKKELFLYVFLMFIVYKFESHRCDWSHLIVNDCFVLIV